MRKKTVFRLCSKHEGMARGYDLAKIVCEGGPRWGCEEGSPCVIRPGSDYFAQGCTDDEFVQLVAGWPANKR